MTIYLLKTTPREVIILADLLYATGFFYSHTAILFLSRKSDLTPSRSKGIPTIMVRPTRKARVHRHLWTTGKLGFLQLCAGVIGVLRKILHSYDV